MREPIAKPIRRHPNDGLGRRLLLLAAWSFTLGLGASSLALAGPWGWPTLVAQGAVLVFTLCAAVWSGQAVLNLFGMWDDGKKEDGDAWND